MSRTTARSSPHPAPSAPHPAAGGDPALPADDNGDPTPHPSSPGREANGRFCKGNLGGPGNPFARQTAALRKHLLEAVTKEDMDAICTMLILRARGGSIPHLKLLFSYVIGKPTDAVNPDTLDRQEMEQYRQELGMEDLVLAVGRAMTPQVACELVQVVRPLVMSHLMNGIADQLVEGLPPEFQPDPGDLPGDREAAMPEPSANGEIGVAQEEEAPAAPDKAPSPEGDKRPAARKTAPSANGEKRPAVQAADARCREKTAGDGARTPQPRQVPPWPGGGHPAAAPTARGPAPGSAGRQRAADGDAGPPPDRKTEPAGLPAAQTGRGHGRGGGLPIESSIGILPARNRACQDNPPE
jgi:hypothetical protein